MASKIKVYDVTTGELYDSLSAASKALGIDASNIRKVIDGSRLAAGGHNFLPAGTDTKAQLRRKGKKLLSKLSPEQLERQARARGEDPELIALRQEAFETIRATNKRLGEMQKLRVIEFSSLAKQALNFKEILGSNSRGLLNGSMKNLETLNKVELAAINNALKAKLSYSSFTASFALGESDRIGQIFGLDSAYAIKYRKTLSLLWETLDDVNDHGDDSDEIVHNVRDMMEDGKSVSYIKQYLETEKAYLDTRDEVFNLFSVAKSKWGWLKSDTEADSNIIKLVKLQSIHPDNADLNKAVAEVTQLLKKSKSKKAVETISPQLSAIAKSAILVAQLTTKQDFTDDIDSIVTYYDVLNFIE